MIKSLIVFSSVLGLANAECPNGCSSHGKCTAYDMCLCYRNWMSNDCSERVCQFGLAHVDTPKGDLDSSSGALDGPDQLVALNSEVYPYGTTEQFPSMMDGSGNYLDNTAHYYMECSNKGICDREAGTCECFPGYEGSACQRASCPSTGGATCSGHGTCQSIKQISGRDWGNIYELWDEEASMGCVCDPGYYGADCALRECKYGADPLYFDDNANIRYSNWTVVLTATHHPTEAVLSGEYAIVFYDHFGEDWMTGPIDAAATCDDIIKALEDIPNDVIPDGSVRCVMFDSTDTDLLLDWYPAVDTVFHIFTKYTIMFPENPGKLKEIALTKYLDGLRPTLTTDEAVSTLQMYVYANGFSGEDVDLVPDECEDVIVKFKRETNTGPSAETLGTLTHFYTLDFTDALVMRPLLKRCLGDADNDQTFSGMENEVYNWDYGTDLNPHLVKFVDNNDAPVNRICRSITDHALVDPTHVAGGYCYEPAPAGFFAPVIYEAGLGGVDGEFVVYSNAPLDFDINGFADNEFRVFTTQGHLVRVAADADVYTLGYPNIHSNTVYTWNLGTAVNTLLDGTPDLAYRPQFGVNGWTGGIDCEKNSPRSVISANDPIPYDDCLNKGDYVMFFSTHNDDLSYAQNPRYHNIYTVEKIYDAYPTVDTALAAAQDPLRNRIVLDMHVNFQSIRTDAAGGTNAQIAARARLRAYKFYPAATVSYVDECSGRGLCNAAEGICECFEGYTNDDCSIQNSAAH